MHFNFMINVFCLEADAFLNTKTVLSNQSFLCKFDSKKHCFQKNDINFKMSK